MKTKYTIKNFRVFDDEGATFDLSPITILTGCNSSGKSSMVKSLLLLCDYFSSIKAAKENGRKIELASHKLDFMKKPNNTLGKFSKVINYHSESGIVTFCIRAHSLMLAQDVDVELSFCANENDLQTNGYLCAFAVKKLDGTIIYSSSKASSCDADLYSVLPEFFRFCQMQHMISYCQSETISKDLLGDSKLTDEEFHQLKDHLIDSINEFKKENGRAALLDINRWNNMHERRSFIYLANENPKVIDKAMEAGILYYLPALDSKLNGNKQECLSFLRDCLNDGKRSEACKFMLTKVMEDFEGSTYDSFIDYYKNWEKSYLSSYKNQEFPSKESAPKLFHANGRTLQATNICLSPYNVVSSSPVFLDDADAPKSAETWNREEEIKKWQSSPLDFPKLFEVIAILSETTLDGVQYHNTPDRYTPCYSSRLDLLFFKFIETAIEEIVTEACPSALSYVSSSIINVRRLYPLESEDEFTHLLKRYFDAKRNIDTLAEYVPDTFMDKWLKELGIGEHISIDVDSEGLGVTLRLHKNEDDKEGSLLADNGYGLTQLFAILLNIEVAIMERKVERVIADENITPMADSNVLAFSSPTIAVEEPEIHLHPNFQSRLADMFVEAYKSYDIHFILETHSEYLIRKLQTYMPLKKEKNGGLIKEEVSLYYIFNAVPVNRPKKEPQVKKIGFREDGSLDSAFGKGFFDEADNLAMSLFF